MYNIHVDKEVIDLNYPGFPNGWIQSSCSVIPNNLKIKSPGTRSRAVNSDLSDQRENPFTMPGSLLKIFKYVLE